MGAGAWQIKLSCVMKDADTGIIRLLWLLLTSLSLHPAKYVVYIELSMCNVTGGDQEDRGIERMKQWTTIIFKN